MRVDVYVPLLVSLLFGLAAPRLSRRLPPARATWLLSIGSVVIAGTTVVTLSLLALTAIAQQPDVAAAGHWTVAGLRRLDPVHWSVAVAALAAIPVLATLVLRMAVRRFRAIAAAYRTCRALPDGASLVVLAEPGIAAYAVPGRPGKVVVSRDLLGALPPEQRRVVLAHEHAHLDHSHYAHVTAVALAAALNPLLARLPAAIGYTIERWADEEAAGDDRSVAATALARTGLLAAATPVPAALGMAGTHVTARVGALLADPPRSRPVLTALAVGVIVLAGIAAVGATHDAHQLIELAQRTRH